MCRSPFKGSFRFLAAADPHKPDGLELEHSLADSVLGPAVGGGLYRHQDLNNRFVLMSPARPVACMASSLLTATKWDQIRREMG